tara:strand:- start:3068 stop:4012 length:945 start_codon:yes stop_codon:yes gene_type:complete
MQKSQTLSNIASEIIRNLDRHLNDQDNSIVFVHGDTSTTLYAALSAFYNKIPVIHIEAGLRTNDIYSPWPEEANRRLVSGISDLNFAPTKVAAENLINENISKEKVLICGNTVIDSLFLIVKKINQDKRLIKELDESFNYLDKKKKLILVTGHRRENFGDGFKNICSALSKIAKNRDDVEIVYPVHLNPNVQKPVRELLENHKNIFLIPPLDYLPFIFLMQKSHIILTDSGGIQEEAPSLGKPVLVMRNKTERPEAIEAETARLVGTDVKNILENIDEVLDNAALYEKISTTHNPYGDGKAAIRILSHIKDNYV